MCEPEAACGRCNPRSLDFRDLALAAFQPGATDRQAIRRGDELLPSPSDELTQGGPF
jgi:hypothetical protein